MFLRWLDRARHPGALEPLPQQPASLEASRLAGRGAGALSGEGTTPGADHVGLKAWDPGSRGMCPVGCAHETMDVVFFSF